MHRLPEQHGCDFDHKEEGRREAREKIVKPTRHLGTSFQRLDHHSWFVGIYFFSFKNNFFKRVSSHWVSICPVFVFPEELPSLVFASTANCHGNCPEFQTSSAHFLWEDWIGTTKHHIQSARNLLRESPFICALLVFLLTVDQKYCQFYQEPWSFSSKHCLCRNGQCMLLNACVGQYLGFGSLWRHFACDWSKDWMNLDVSMSAAKSLRNANIEILHFCVTANLCLFFFMCVWWWLMTYVSI